MTDLRPDSGDPTESTDPSSIAPEPEEVEAAAEQPPEAGSEVPAEEADAAATEGVEEVDGAETAADDTGDAGASEEADAAAETIAVEDGGVPATIVETEAEAADAAAAGAAWTTTPVAPDPEATEAALAALAAKPEVTLEPPEAPPVPPPGVGSEPPDEGTPVLLVGGILVGAFIAALAIVLILFRPFDTVVEPTLSPSPVVTEAPSASPSAIPVVDTPNFQGLSLEDAEAKADDYGLVVRADPVETDDEEPGTILDQDPAPGESVDAGSTVELSFAVPVPTVAVPDLLGLSEDDFLDELDDAGLVPGDRTESAPRPWPCPISWTAPRPLPSSSSTPPASSRVRSARPTT